MSAAFSEIISDLEGEHAALGKVLGELSTAVWDTPTHAPGWSVRDQVSHLSFFDEAAALAIADGEAFTAGARAAPEQVTEPESSYLARGRGLAPSDVLDWWHTASAALITEARPLDAKARVPWYGPEMGAASFITARLMETWSHGLDIVDVVDGDRPDTDRLRHIAFLGSRTRAYSYMARGMELPATPVRVELTSPSGEEWVLGDVDATEVIRGAATDFCRVVTQRRHLADTNLEVRGAAAEEWMTIAQAFAGPPGAGRQPGEFAEEQKA